MAWATPITWSDNTVYDEDDLNQHIRDNLGFLYFPPSCLTVNNAQQNIGSSTSNSNVAMQSEQWDNSGMHSGSSHQHEIQIAGRYLSFGAWEMTANGSGRRVLTLAPSSGQSIESRIVDPSAAVEHCAQASGMFELAAAATISLHAQQNSGITLALFAFNAWMLSHWCGNP